MHKKYLLSLFIFGIGSSILGLTKNDLQQKTLAELKVLLEEESIKLSPTPAAKKVLKLWKGFGELRIATGPLATSCVAAHRIGSWAGSFDDCPKALDMDKKMDEHKRKIRTAEKKFRKANPDFALIEECILEKEYEEMEVE